MQIENALCEIQEIIYQRNKTPLRDHCFIKAAMFFSAKKAPYKSIINIYVVSL